MGESASLAGGDGDTADFWTLYTIPPMQFRCVSSTAPEVKSKPAPGLAPSESLVTLPIRDYYTINIIINAPKE
jgi:hypothetical protein